LLRRTFQQKLTAFAQWRSDKPKKIFITRARFFNCSRA
jgi:hypothetical protein